MIGIIQSQPSRIRYVPSGTLAPPLVRRLPRDLGPLLRRELRRPSCPALLAHRDGCLVLAVGGGGIVFFVMLAGGNLHDPYCVADYVGWPLLALWTLGHARSPECLTLSI